MNIALFNLSSLGHHISYFSVYVVSTIYFCELYFFLILWNYVCNAYCILNFTKSYSSQIILFTAGKNRILFVTRFEHICHRSWEICDRSRLLCTLKSHSSQKSMFLQLSHICHRLLCQYCRYTVLIYMYAYTLGIINRWLCYRFRCCCCFCCCCCCCCCWCCCYCC